MRKRFLVVCNTFSPMQSHCCHDRIAPLVINIKTTTDCQWRFLCGQISDRSSHAAACAFGDS
jgi:hypothetical protein